MAAACQSTPPSATATATGSGKQRTPTHGTPRMPLLWHDERTDHGGKGHAMGKRIHVSSRAGSMVCPACGVGELLRHDRGLPLRLGGRPLRRERQLRPQRKPSQVRGGHGQAQLLPGPPCGAGGPLLGDPQRPSSDTTKLSRATGHDCLFLHGRRPDDGLCRGSGRTQATLSWRANSSETSSPGENALTCQPSSGAREPRYRLVAPSEQNTATTPSPLRKKVWGAAKPVG